LIRQQKEDETHFDEETSSDYFGLQRKEEGDQRIAKIGYKGSSMKINNRSKKKKENLKGRLPYGYEETDHRAEEKYLGELERLAGRSSAQDYEQRSFSRNSGSFSRNSYDSNASAYSDTEAEFMFRQKTASPNNFNPSVQLQRSFVDLNETDNLQERVDMYSKQITTLVAAIERKEGEQEKTEDKLRRTFTELEAIKRASNSEKAQIEKNHEQALILLKEQHLKDMAQMASSLSLFPSSPTKYGEIIALAVPIFIYIYTKI
jgi:hypothetical protein